MEPVTTVGLLKSAVELLKSAAGVAQKIKNADLNEKLVSLQTVILDLQSRLLGLESEKAELVGELAKMKEIERDAKKLTFSKGVYWKNLESRGVDGPYCPNCWDMDRRLIRLNRIEAHFFSCTFHKTSFDTSGQ